MGRKPVGKKAMTDAERQRRRRQKLRAARAVSVTEGQSRKIERLEKENQRLREDAKEWKRLHDEQAARVERQRKEIEALKKEAAQYGDWRFQKQQAELDALLEPSVITKWLRTLARRFHPDRGGSDEQMKVVNEAHELLRKLLQAAAAP